MANASAVTSPAPGGPVLSTPLISVVDDDASVRAATENLLKSRGYVVQTFVSAEEFLRSPRLNETSCVITDVQMPVMSGLDLLAEMRTRGYGVPFIFITAFPNDRVRASALSAGAAGFLAKPFAGHTLIEYLDAALEENGGGGNT
ncbi:MULTISPECIES: response regulator transcription factor [Bradyrhizobium]|uniref:response regulator transcription factor n=1 Tax=Bradyrhizobium TaxID=374 RepID=UPI0014577C39|nr:MULTISPECIES: response regulator [Bradyrhizobium]MBR1164756.1 response regulator [Bradyrhizobium elkanii]NLS67746.1 response regulator [Bradyrhizobium brasilense]